MMRALGILTASAAILAAAPASAQVVQYSSGSAPLLGAFTHFDSALGTLTGVNLHVTATDNRSGTAFGSTSVNWNIHGSLVLTISQIGGSSLSPLTLALTGQDTALVNSDGVFDYAGTGSGDFALNPAFFLFDSPLSYDFRIASLDAGLSGGGDASFQPVGGSSASAISNRCFGGTTPGPDFCNFIGYTLTYNYTPVDAAAPVPEPGTWAMMLLGLFATGLGIRHAHRTGSKVVA